MLLSKYPWWAFALVTVMLLNPIAFLGFTSTLMILTLFWPYKDASHTWFVLSFGGFHLALFVLNMTIKVAVNG